QRLLVSDNVRWQDPVADRKSDQPLSDQFADAADLEDERRRVAAALRPAHVAGSGQGMQLAASAERSDLYGDAALLAENRSAFDSAGRQRDMAAARYKAGLMAPGAILLMHFGAV